MSEGFYEVHPYSPPAWASCLKHVPTRFVKISALNTPIHKWNVPEVPRGFSISIKRDDLTGAELSGSKVRCLQFILAEAVTSGCRHVVTGGGLPSGHCRAVSLLCRALNLIPHVVLYNVNKIEDIVPEANALLYRLAGSHIYQVPIEHYTNYKRRLSKMAEYISSKYAEKCYSIPVGGLTASGVFGCISAFDELLKQGLHERFDDIVICIGSGCAALGLALGNYLTGSKVRVHAVAIALPAEYSRETLNCLLDDLGVTDVKADDILDIIEGYLGEKYGTVSEEVLDFCPVQTMAKTNKMTLSPRKSNFSVGCVVGLVLAYIDVRYFIVRTSTSTGILLDPYYTGKGAMGMMREIERCPERFKGKRILFYHTGGMFGLFNGELKRVIDKDVTNNVRVWPDIDHTPF